MTLVSAIKADVDAARERDERLAYAVESERLRREARRIVDTEERGGDIVPGGLTLREFLSVDDGPLEYRIADFQPVGTRVMCAATFKSGKTTLRDQVAGLVVDGGRFLGAYDVVPIDGAVAMIDTEMSPRQLRAWLRDQRIRHDDRIVLFSLRGAAASLNLLDARVRARWAAQLSAFNVRYLILDCLRPVLDALGLDEKNEAGRFLVAFDALLAEAGVPEALILHHMGHVGGERSRERARGDSRLRDYPDVEWRIVRQDDDPSSSRYISAYGRDVDVPEQLLAYDKATRRLSVAGGSRRDQARDAALEAVIETIGERALSGRQIEAEMQDSDHPRMAIRAALRTGIQTNRLIVEPGAHRARLYRVSQRAAVRQQCASAASVSAPPPIDRRRTSALQNNGIPAEHSGALISDERGLPDAGLY